jgi:ankyrin repeat protein
MSQELKREEIEKELIILRIDINKLSKLNLYCAYGYTDSIMKLIENGININDEDKSGNTPLLIACMLGYTRLPKMLIKYGADVNKPNKYGVRPLHMAVLYGHVSTVQLLLQFGADKYAEVNEYDGCTPIDFIKKTSPNYDKISKLLA